MEKTISITIAGLIFHMESSAYARLESWLSAVRLHFGRYDDSEEILRDIENRIAEIFARRTDNSKRVVTMTDVSVVISQIGTVEDFEHFDTAADGDPREKSATQKHLYRDRDNSVLGGVAAGVAAYFGIDVILTRILFIIFALIWGISILIYIVLWIMMPVADTPAKKLEMKGKPFTLAGLEEKIKAKVPPKNEITSSLERLLYRFADFLRVVGEAAIVFLRKAMPILLTIIGAVLAVTGAVVALVFTVMFIVMLTNAPDTWFGISLSHIASSPLIHYAFITSVYLLLAIPAVLILMAGLALMRPKKRTRRSSAPVVLLSIWAIVLLATIIISIREIPAYQANYHAYISGLEQQERAFEVNAFRTVSVSGEHEVTIVPSDIHFVKALGDEQVLQRQLSVRIDGRELDINNNLSCFFCSLRPARLEIGMPDPERLRFSGETRATLNGFQLDRLALQLSGSSRFDSDSDIKDLIVSISGSSRAAFTGDINRAEIKASGSSCQLIQQPLEILNVRASGSSRVEVGEVQRFIEADLTGGSVLHFSGKPEDSDIRSSSGSRVNSP